MLSSQGYGSLPEDAERSAVLEAAGSAPMSRSSALGNVRRLMVSPAFGMLLMILLVRYGSDGLKYAHKVSGHSRDGISTSGSAAAVAAAAAAAAVARAAPASESPTSVLSFAVTRADYPVPGSLAFYPWEHVAEPFVASTLTARGHRADSRVFWSVTRNHAGTPGRAGVLELDNAEGHIGHHNFTRVTREYNVTLRVLHADATERTVSAIVVCKYVRREIRKLSDADREAYFSAMSVVARTDLQEGRERYGANFVNLVYETVKHVHGLSCSPFHGGLSFLTAHAAFTLEVDRALQTIDPAVVTPYWDVTIDSQQHGAAWDESILFSDDWFGAATPANADRQIDGKWFNATPVPVSCEFEVHNAYCRVTDQRNEDASVYATRSHELCGLKTDVVLPGCAELAECLDTRSLVELHSCAEDVLHGNIHTVIGGFWDCPYDLGELAEEHPDWQEMLLGVGTRSINIWQASYGAKHLTCPKSCDADADSFDTCKCHCPSLDLAQAQPGGLTVDWVKGFFNETKIVFFENWRAGSKAGCEDGFNSPYVYKKYFDIQYKDSTSTCDYSIRGFDNDDNKEFLHFLAGYACSPGKVGAMSTGGSSNDPIFWPLHPSFDRLWHYVRMAPEYAEFDNSWPADHCDGRSYEDLMPFHSLQDDDDDDDDAGGATAAADADELAVSTTGGDASGNHFYSNRELFKMFAPQSSRLQYIYDDFDFSHCGAEIHTSFDNATLEATFTTDQRQKPTFR